MRDSASLLSSILAVLLVVMSPVGTGEGVHRDQLLDPLFPHIHPGVSLTSFHATAARKFSSIFTDRQHGPALGAGAGAASGVLGLGLTPPVPRGAAALPVTELWWLLEPISLVPVGAPTDAPPDPPPTDA